MGDIGDKTKRRRRTAVCAGCGLPIRDRYLLRVAPDLEWHAACLRCATCATPLETAASCFVRDGKTFCRRDYASLFGIKCTKCKAAFGRNELAMRARSHAYHVGCFRCEACARPLIPGDEFALRDGGLFCRADQHLATAPGASPSPPHSLTGDELPPMRTKMAGLSSEKATRVRTVLNEKQLQTLRTCYAANPRPDALMKEQLVEMTALSPRVIRVWFQNKRCKDKKRTLFMKQMQNQAVSDKANLAGLTGTPLVARSPIPHEAAMPANPVEVRAFQAAQWKALGEFTLAEEMEHATFPGLGCFQDADLGSNSMGSDLSSVPSQLPDTPSSMVASPIEA
uniref:insulin gene enhancer protein ISL-1-like n=1 Tax=Myxine glutinosa TaxID=7769 RepID=UPI00358E3DBC